MSDASKPQDTASNELLRSFERERDAAADKHNFSYFSPVRMPPDSPGSADISGHFKLGADFGYAFAMKETKHVHDKFDEVLDEREELKKECERLDKEIEELKEYRFMYEGLCK